MTASTAAASEGSAPRPRKVVMPWEQEPGENDLWYARFLRFVALGPTGPVGPRSVSLVSTGQRNYYPVPAHWPMVAKQRQWRQRAAAFDEAARKDEAMIKEFDLLILAHARARAPESEKALLEGVTYNRPADDEAE